MLLKATVKQVAGPKQEGGTPKTNPGAIISTETSKDHPAKGQLFDQRGDEYGGDEPGQGSGEFKGAESGRGNEVARGQQPNGQAPNDG